MKKIEKIRECFDKGNFDLIQISIDTGAALNTVKVQHSRWKKEHKPSN